MKRNYWLFLAAIAGIVPYIVYAATGTIWTLTGNGSRRNTVEFTIESPTVGSAASLLPGTDNANSIGSDSLRLAAIQSYDITAADDLTVTGDATITGLTINTPALSAIGSATTITPATSFVMYTSTGGAIDVQSTPTITTTSYTNGTVVTVFSTTATITVNDTDSVAGSLLELGAASRALGVGDGLRLRYYDGYWYEEAFFNN